MGESYDGRAAVPSISREGVTQKSCRVTATQSIIKVTEQSVCFGRVTAFPERRVTGVLVVIPRFLVNMFSATPHFLNQLRYVIDVTHNTNGYST